MHTQAVRPRPSTWHVTKTTHTIQTQDMMEQEHHDDNARGEPATPSTSTTTTTREGRQRPADPDDLDSPRSRGPAPSALPPRYTARTRNQRPNAARAITPALPTQPGPKGGRRQGRERQDANWNWSQTKPHHNVPTRALAPQTNPQAPQHASVPRAWTAGSIAKTRTTATYRGATPTTPTAPTTEAEGEHQKHTPQALHTPCTAHNKKEPDTPKGTPTAAPRRPAQQGPTGKSKPEDRGHTDNWTRNMTHTHYSTVTTATDPQAEPQTPHRVSVPRATTAHSTACETRATASRLNTRHNTTATGTMPRGRNHKRSRWSRKQHSQVRQRTTHTMHHYPYHVEHLAPRWKPTPSCRPLPKPLTHPWNQCPVASTSLRTTTPWT